MTAGQRYPDILTPEREAMLREALEEVQVSYSSAGRAKEEVALAIRVSDEVRMLRGRGVLTEVQGLAAERLQHLFYLAGLEGVPGMPMGQDYVDKSMVKDEAMVARLDHVDDYIRAIKNVPLLSWPVVRAVVLGGHSIEHILRGVRRNYHALRARAIVQLQTGLEELAEHFGLKSRKRRPHKWRGPGGENA